MCAPVAGDPFGVGGEARATGGVKTGSASLRFALFFGEISAAFLATEVDDVGGDLFPF